MSARHGGAHVDKLYRQYVSAKRADIINYVPTIGGQRIFINLLLNLSKLTFRAPEDKLLHDERPSFAAQKTAFRNTLIIR